MRKIIDTIALIENEYRGEHGAPEKENGAPLYDLTLLYPADIYSAEGARLYADDAMESFGIAMAFKGRPNKIVTIYRAVPKSLVRPKIQPGDWVSISKAYVREHGRDNLNNDYKIITKLVSARDLYTEGNSLDEWGYDPQPNVRRAEEDAIRTKLGMKTKTQAQQEHYARLEAQGKIAESATAEPTIEWDDSENCWQFNGFGVSMHFDGDVETAIRIHVFSSHRGGKGNAERAMRWLRAHCPHIEVSDPGHPSSSPETFGFWSSMADKRLIDELQDAHDNPIFKNGAWLPHEDGWAR